MGSDREPSRASGVLVTVGVGTHRDLHVVAALDQHGHYLGTRTFPATPAGFGALTAWARAFGTLDRVGIEGTGSYGARLARWLRARGLPVLRGRAPAPAGSSGPSPPREIRPH